jgi:hypothetical protein
MQEVVCERKSVNTSIQPLNPDQLLQLMLPVIQTLNNQKKLEKAGIFT